MPILSRLTTKLREVARMTVRRDPEVARQVHEAAREIQTNKHLLREIRAVQRELERPRPPDNREAPWKHLSSH